VGHDLTFALGDPLHVCSVRGYPFPRSSLISPPRNAVHAPLVPSTRLPGRGIPPRTMEHPLNSVRHKDGQYQSHETSSTSLTN